MSQCILKLKHRKRTIRHLKGIMKSLCLTNLISIFWPIKVITFCRYDKWTHLLDSFHNGNLILFGKFIPTLLEVPTNVLHLQVVLLSPFSPVHPIPALWGLALETILAIPLFEACHLVLFFRGNSDSLDVCFGSSSCCRMTLWATRHRPESILWFCKALW